RNFNMEQRAVIKFNAKLDKSASETFRSMQQVYGSQCLGRTAVFEWHKHFLEDRETLEDDKKSGRLILVRTPEMIEKVRDFVANDRNASLKMMEEALNISILHEDLGKTKVCAKFVPHTLRSDQKSARINYSRDIVAAAENNPNFLKSIVTGDETWCFQYDPETKHQSAEWKSKNSPQAKKVRKRLMGRIHIRPEYRDPEDWSLLHDNAPNHTSLIVRQCLLKPYLSDLAPCDFSLFPKLKLKLKGRFFDDIPTIQSASTQALEAIPQTELKHAFESLLNRCNKCIEARGEYFE
ncbi:SETMR methyltransferase, partial [Acromyrmex charruanus]